MFLDAIVRRVLALIAQSPTAKSISPPIVDAHAALARTLASGDPIAADPTGALGALNATGLRTAATSVPSPPEASNVRGYVRLLPTAGSIDRRNVPIWAHGMAVSASAGPFPDEHGIASFIDTIVPTVTPFLAIVRAPVGAVIAYLQANSVSETSSGGVTTVTFGAGSVWFVASGFDAVSPANAYAGLAFSVATLTVPGGLASTPVPEWNLPAGTTAALVIVPAAAAPEAGSLVNDGSQAVATLPAVITFALAPSGIRISELGSATLAAYGQSVDLIGPIAPASAAYDAAALALTVPFASTVPSEFTIATNASPTLQLTGTAPIGGAFFRIPVALTTPANLAAAASGGALSFALGAGLQAHWGNLGTGVRASVAQLDVETGSLALAFTTTSRPFADAYPLWDATGGGTARATSIALHGARGVTVVAAQTHSLDIVTTIGCTLEADLDRPRTVAGTTARFDLLVVDATVGRIATGGILLVLGTAKPTLAGRVETFALENALLRTDGIGGLFLFAAVNGGRATRGTLLTGTALGSVVPALPDPYAATLPDTGITLERQTLLGITRWKTPSTVAFGFALPHLTTAAAAAHDSTAAASISTTALASQMTTPTIVLAARSVFSVRDQARPLLFDVSGNADQFGVYYTPQALATAGIIGQALAVGGDASVLVTVPDVAWEPVIDARRDFVPPFASDDGDPAYVAVTSVTLRPAEPRAFVKQFITDYAAGADLFASLTLPFGLTAQIDTSRNTADTPELRPTLTDNAPAFPAASLTGGAQLSIVGQPDPTTSQAVLPGQSRADGEYAQNMLSADIAHSIAGFWNQDFGGEALPGAVSSRFVPLERIDLSGYGLSTFSNYVDPSPDPGIAHARFDVIAGRTSYEIVQAQSVIMPHHIPVVNTTIFSRDDNGYVDRTNSGWQAKGPGEFVFTDAGSPAIELGGIRGLYNIRNISEIPGSNAHVNNKDWIGVTFDADVALQTDATALTVKGAPTFEINGVATPFLPSHDLTGWLDLSANPTHDPALRPGFEDARQLLAQLGPANGPLAADADVAGTGIGVTLTGIQIKATRNDAPEPTIGVAFATTPHLPRDGAWSIGTRTSAQSAPRPVDARTPVPLVRPLGTDVWHFADPADLHALDAPAQLYGFVQGTGTQKAFFEHPTVTVPSGGGGAGPLNFVQPPRLADVGALLGSSGLLPDIGSLLDFKSFSGFAPAGDGFGGQTLENDVVITDKTLLSLGIVRVVMASYPDGATSHIAATIDAAAPAGTPRWKVSIDNVAFKLFVDGGDALVTIHGTVSAQDGSAPSLSPIAVEYGSLLDSVRSILVGIETFVQFLPNAGKSGIDVSFAGSALRVREAFPIPQLPLGIGFLENIALDLGFDVDLLARTIHFFVGVGTDRDPFHWLVSPLSGNGLLQLGATDSLGVDMQAGIGVGLGIDLAIASGSASIVLAFKIDTTQPPFSVMVLLTGNASVDVLDGLASVSLTLTAGIGIRVVPPWIDPVRTLEDPIGFLKGTIVTLSAEVAVGIHITVCWVEHIDFDDSWPFSESISGATLTDLIP